MAGGGSAVEAVGVGSSTCWSERPQISAPTAGCIQPREAEVRLSATSFYVPCPLRLPAHRPGSTGAACRDMPGDGNGQQSSRIRGRTHSRRAKGEMRAVMQLHGCCEAGPSPMAQSLVRLSREHTGVP